MLVLSDYLKQQRKDLTKIVIKLSSSPLIIDKLYNKICNNLLTLSLNHCQISTLEGIDQFNSLQTLSLKYNDLTDYRQVFRINSNSLKTLKDINIKGNDIEHHHQMTYMKLKHSIPNLQCLNQKLYKNDLLKKNQIKSLNKIFKQMDLVKNQIRKHIKKSNFIKKKQLDKPQFESFLQNQLELDYYADSKQNQHDISVSKIAMTKSIRNSLDNAVKKKNILQINTSQANIIYPATTIQPTATFAKQKQYQESQILNFKNKNKSLYNSEYTDYQDPLGMTKKNLMGGSVFGQIQQNIDTNMEDITTALYQQSLIKKAFYGLHNFSKRQMYMPKKSQFF